MALIQAAFMHHPETMLMEMRSTCAGHKVPARAQACHRQHAAHFIIKASQSEGFATVNVQEAAKMLEDGWSYIDVR